MSFILRSSVTKRSWLMINQPLGRKLRESFFFRPLNAKRARQDQNATEGPKTRRRLPAPSPEKQVLPTSSTCSPWSPLEQKRRDEGGTVEVFSGQRIVDQNKRRPRTGLNLLRVFSILLGKPQGLRTSIAALRQLASSADAGTSAKSARKPSCPLNDFSPLQLHPSQLFHPPPSPPKTPSSNNNRPLL
ncbi:hypothetical protein BDY24DRAFT_84446 [Mrakia frigida]|uniref:uncharacterized protein n=1 Tax=Mrakia frigida TaxID=29902 RepID=UPI003FCC1A54